jgi:CheY-like chemotaxis protein
LTISVSDNGIGLREGALARVFEMFSQDEGAVGRSQGGLGIGLALVKGLVSLHGGSVTATSPGPGRGSTFTIRLTKDSFAAPSDATTSSPALQPPEGARCRVLVADDNVDAADSLAMVLSASGFSTTVAYTGKEALEVGRRLQPDVFVLDIGMPGLSGYDVAREIRGAEWRKRPYLIAVTGWGQLEDKDRARAAGFDDHFTKPVDVQALEERLTEYAEQREG